MASFREHVTFSSLLGIGYGCLAHFYAGYTPQQGALAGCLAGIGGMLPDLDLPTGRPGQEIFALTAAVAPLILVGRVLRWTGLPADAETTMVCVVIMYLLIRYGMAELVRRFCTHRGMFHSIPALLIAGELVYLGYPSTQVSAKLLMGAGVAIGFLSHLLLDELWSVEWKHGLPGLKKSSGTAFKMFGEQFVPNAVTFALLATTSFYVLQDTGVIEVNPASPQSAETGDSPASPSAPILREASLPPELQATPAATLGPPGQTTLTPDVQLNVGATLGEAQPLPAANFSDPQSPVTLPIPTPAFPAPSPSPTPPGAFPGSEL